MTGRVVCQKIILGLIRHFALKGVYKLIISVPEFFKVITDDERCC